MALLNRWAPWVQISTPRVLLPFVVREFVVHRAEGGHEWAQLTLRYHLAAGIQAVLTELPPELWWPENRPVRVRFGAHRAVADEFIGYVVSPERLPATDAPQNIPGQMLDVRYTLLGPTKPLQSARTRMWSQCQAPYMAQEIAGEVGLSALTGKHPRIFDRQQAGLSDFAFLRQMSQEIGWRLTACGPQISLTDPRSVLVSSVPVFRQRSIAGKQDTMTDFRAVTGELDPAGSVRAQHVAEAISAAGAISQAQATATRRDVVTGLNVAAQIQRYSSTYVASSYEDVAAITQAAATRDLWWAQATATVDGDVRLRPGCAVELGGEALTQQYQGKWMTRSAHHRITLSQIDPRLSAYYVDLELGRDQTDRLSEGPRLELPLVQGTLVNGRWMAQRVGAG